jgi:hypothetical protein
MAQSTILALLADSAHSAQNSEPQSIIGESQPAAAYYIARNSLQTVSWALGSTFTGSITIQCSLVSEPDDNDWADILEIDSESRKNGFENVNGNFVWLRATVNEWTAGTVHFIRVTY